MTTTEKPQSRASGELNRQPRLTLGLALSGGGFRATLFHLGVLKCLSDAGLLGRVSHVTSVSGGSILAAHLFEHWQGYLVDFAKTARPLIEFVQYDIRGRILRRLPYSFFHHRWRRTELLQEYYHKLFLPKLSEAAVVAPVGELLPPRPRIAILATNLNTGSMYAFSEHYVYVASRDAVKALRTDLPHTSLKVAISSAFPGFFPPITLSHHDVALDVAEFQESQCFTDGGVFDNLGIRFYQRAYELNSQSERQPADGAGDHFWNDVPHLVVASNASSTFDVRRGTRTLFGTALRAVDILMNRIGIMDVESIIGGHSAHANRFRYLALDTIVDTDADPQCLNVALQKSVRFIRTDLDAFSNFECRCLIQHGYSVAHRELNHLARNAAIPPGELTQELEAGLSRIADLEPWDPFDRAPPLSSLEQPLRGDANSEASTHLAEKQCRLLHKGSCTRLRFFALNDPVPTLMNVAILIAVLVAIFYVTWQALVPSEPHWLTDAIVANIRESKVLRVGVLDEPEMDLGFLLYQQKGELATRGFDVDLSQQIARRLPKWLDIEGELKLDFEPEKWAGLLDMPRRGEADIIISSISFTVERERQYQLRFSVPYHQTSLSILGHSPEIKEIKFERLREHVAGKAVLVMAGTTSVHVASWLSEELGWTVREIDSFEEIQQAFIAQPEVLALTDSPLAISMERNGDGFARELETGDFPLDVPPERRKEYYVIGIPTKSARLAWAINGIIVEMANDGSLTKLREEAQQQYQQYKDELRTALNGSFNGSQVTVPAARLPAASQTSSAKNGQK